MVKGLDDLAPEGLLDRARKAAGLVDDAARVRIFCHYDPDGTTSASILARALMRRGKRIHATMAHALDGTSAARLQEESNELLDDDRIRKAFEEIELAGSHVAHDQELVRFLLEAGGGRPIEGVRHSRVDSLAAAHQGPGQDRGGGRAVRIVMAEDADPGRVVDETRGLPRPIEQALGRQIVQALDHGPPTSLAAPRASRRNPSPPAGRRATCSTGTVGGCVTRSTRGRVGCSGPSDGP